MKKVLFLLLMAVSALSLRGQAYLDTVSVLVTRTDVGYDTTYITVRYDLKVESGTDSVVLGGLMNATAYFNFLEPDSSLEVVYVKTSLPTPSVVNFPGQVIVGNSEVGQSYTIVSVGDSAFGNWPGLSVFHCGSLTLPSTIVRLKPWAFRAAVINKLYLPTSIKEYQPYVFYAAELGQLHYLGTLEQWIDLDFQSQDSNPVSLSKNLFIGDTLVTHVPLPDTLVRLKPYVFSFDTAIRSVYLPEGLRVIGTKAFGYCRQLDNVVIPESMDTIGNKCFEFCDGMTTFTFNARWCRYAGTAGQTLFANCHSLENIHFGKYVGRIPDYMFMYVDAITSVDLPPSLEEIGNASFAQCRGIRGTVRIPKNFHRFGGHSFADCIGIDTVLYEAPSCIMSGGYDLPPFYHDTMVSTIVVGKDVEYIPNVAFKWLKRVRHIISKSPEPPFVPNRAAFEDIDEGALLSVPCGSETRYRNEYGWDKFRTVRATAVYTLTALSADTTMGTVRITRVPSCDFLYGDVVAEAKPGYYFAGWSDSVMEPQRRLRIEDDTVIVAFFTDQQGIENVADDGVSVTNEGRTIVVSGDEDQAVLVCDMMGRVLVDRRGTGHDRYPMPKSGVYLVKVGLNPARKLLLW